MALYTVGPSAAYANWSALITAHPNLSAGDIVEYQASVIGGSSTITGDRIFKNGNGNGTSLNPITVRVRTGDSVILDGQNSVVNAIYAADRYTIFDGFTLQNYLTSNTSSSIVIFNQGDGCVIKNSIIHIGYTELTPTGGHDNRGIAILSSSGCGVLNNHIFSDIGTWNVGDIDGMIVGGPNHLISGNLVSIANYSTYSLPDAGHNDCIQTTNASGLIICNNICDRSLAPACGGQGLYVEMYNLDENNPTNYGNIVIRNNLIYGYGGSYIGATVVRPSSSGNKDPIANIQFYNNTLDNYASTGIGNSGLAAGFNFRQGAVGDTWITGAITCYNNIFINRGYSGITPAVGFAPPYQTGNSLISDYNYIYVPFASGATVVIGSSGNNTWSQWKALGYDTHSIGYNNNWSPPNFINDVGGNYNLTSASPVINSGINLYSSFTIDLSGMTRSQFGAWDIGAYKYLSNLYTLVRMGRRPKFGVYHSIG